MAPLLRTMLVLAALAVAACGRGGGAPVGGLSADEAAQLNNAAEMLDASADDLTVPPDNLADEAPGNADQ